MTPLPEQERLQRWRLVLGKDGCPNSTAAGKAGDGLPNDLPSDYLKMDKTLEALYDTDRSGGLGPSCPNINRWLGDIRTYFPKSVVQMMQKDAIERLNLQRLMMEPEVLETLEADVHLVGTLLSLQQVMPAKTKETARTVVQKVVSELERKLRNPMTEAVKGALSRATRTSRPRANEIDWDRTIRKNLKNYLPEKKTIIAERLVGYGRKRSSLRDIVLCIDQSGSMAASIVYSSIFGAVLASLKAVSTKMVVFDTEIVDLTEHLEDPVEVLFATQLGGGTDINRAVGYCQQQITRPSDTIFVLISDLYEGGVEQKLLRRTAEIVASGCQMICLLALSDDGTSCYDERLAAKLSSLGVPSFACTPDLFPDLMAAAIQKENIYQWAAKNEIVTKGLPPE
ncbi:VMA domain YehL ATPase stimulator [Planctomycetales bacterium 10988]|nr:VMA domain YehL ATPase stimulator [Planctomycetales bacterium 10988]